MCIYTVKKQKFKKKFKGVRDSTEGILSGVKDTAETNKEFLQS